MKPQEVNSLVQTPRSDNRASGNNLRECLQRFETLEKDVQFTRVCEDAAFVRKVCTMMSYKSIPDVDDGFGGRASACREYTLPREDTNSRIYVTSPGQTAIGHFTRCLDVGGIEIQIPSTPTKDFLTWVVICRGKNCYVEELHVNDQTTIPQVLSCWSISDWTDLLQRKEKLVQQKCRYHGAARNSCEAVENSDESSEKTF